MTTEGSMSFQMGLHDNSESLKLKNGFKNNKKVIASNPRVFQQMQTPGAEEAPFVLTW